MERQRDLEGRIGPSLLTVNLNQENSTIFAHQVVSHFGVRIVANEEKGAIRNEEKGKDVLPEDSYGYIDFRDYLKGEGVKTADERAHILVSKAYGLADCLLAYDRSDFPKIVTPPRYLLFQVNPAARNLAKRIGFEVVDEVRPDDKPLYLMKGEGEEVQDQLRKEIVGLDPKVHERLAIGAERFNPDFWRDPVDEADIWIARGWDMDEIISERLKGGVHSRQGRTFFGVDALGADYAINTIGMSVVFGVGLVGVATQDRELLATALGLGAVGLAAHIAARKYYNRD